jgi:hypothetical protein
MNDDTDENPAPPQPRRGRPPKATKSNVQVKTVENEEEDELEAIADFTGEELGSDSTSGPPKRRRMVNQVYGLKGWKSTKPVGDSGHFTEMIRSVPVRKRDTRIVGRSGTSQLILSNPDLETLMVEIFTAIDSPADVRTLRQLVLSKIPLQDYNIASLDEELNTGNGSGATLRRDPADTRDTAEDLLLRQEKHHEAAGLANDFLVSLRKAVNQNERRFSRLVSTLWHCFYNPENPSQLEIADLLGVSDSLVSDNRRLIEYELKKLRLSVEEGAIFSESLKTLIEPASFVN